MPDKDPLDSLFSGENNPNSTEAYEYANIQSAAASGALSKSARIVVVITLSEELKDYLAERLEPVVRAADYAYNTKPKMGEATDASFLIMDVTPATDARMHSQYDKIVRMKKSLQKKGDVLCVFGPREKHKRYPRGTYPGLLYFCFESTDPDYPEPDLTVEGQETVGGPTLYNFCDMPEVIGRLIRERDHLK